MAASPRRRVAWRVLVALSLLLPAVPALRVPARAAAPGGYWLVASDGGIFSYGDAGFYGSTGAIKLNQPIPAMASTPSGRGYWLVASDGGIFSFGDAGFYGTALDRPLRPGTGRRVVAMIPTSTGRG